MKDMKMSDVFEGLPVSIDESGDSHHFLQDESDRRSDANCGEFYGEAIGEAVMHAINNHDRLQQENAELREALQSIKDKLNDATSINEMEAFIYMICDASLNKND